MACPYCEQAPTGHGHVTFAMRIHKLAEYKLAPEGGVYCRQLISCTGVRPIKKDVLCPYCEQAPTGHNTSFFAWQTDRAKKTIFNAIFYIYSK